MRRRHTINVWPAFADLMTVLAVVGLFSIFALENLPATHDNLTDRVRDLERIRRELEKQRQQDRQELEAREKEWTEERNTLNRQVREAARNEQMFQAIQEAQKLIDDISRNSGLSFGPDQSLQFGDDLVSFKLNSVVPIWRADSRDRLRRFCQAISVQLARSRGQLNGKRLFVVQVEGHTDSVGCPGDPNCNWGISSGRAANFVSLMRRPDLCPGGRDWILRPIGFADTKALPASLPTRRIAVRLVPDYERLISSRRSFLSR